LIEIAAIAKVFSWPVPVSLHVIGIEQQRRMAKSIWESGHNARSMAGCADRGHSAMADRRRRTVAATSVGACLELRAAIDDNLTTSPIAYSIISYRQRLIVTVLMMSGCAAFVRFGYEK